MSPGPFHRAGDPAVSVADPPGGDHTTKIGTEGRAPITPTSKAAAPTRVGLPEASGCPRGPDVMYLVVYNDPQDPIGNEPTGWTLDAWHGEVVCWTASLGAHGAGALASPRQAKAVAVRSLSDRGIIVDGWDSDTNPDRPTYRARLRPAETPPSDGVTAQTPGPQQDLRTSQ